MGAHPVQHPCHPLGRAAIGRVFAGHPAVPSLWWLLGLGMEVWQATAGSTVNADLDPEERVMGRKLSLFWKGAPVNLSGFPTDCTWPQWEGSCCLQGNLLT